MAKTIVQTMEPELVERVTRGAAWLDVNAPGWENTVKGKTLDVSDYANCVFGQLYGGYRKGIAKTGLSLPEATELGFDGKSRNVYYPECARLTELWREQAQKRLVA